MENITTWRELALLVLLVYVLPCVLYWAWLHWDAYRRRNWIDPE